MENGTSALKLTTASYWRPSGKNIHRFPDSKDTDEWGVKPNDGFEVPMKDEERLEYLHLPPRPRHRPRQAGTARRPAEPKTEKDKDKERSRSRTACCKRPWIISARRSTRWKRPCPPRKSQSGSSPVIRVCERLPGPEGKMIPPPSGKRLRQPVRERL